MDNIPIAILADSYKAGHFIQYPDSEKMVAYSEFRSGFAGDKEDTRQVFLGLRYIVEKYLHHKWTMLDVEKASAFFETHNAGYTPYPFPRDLFEKIVKEKGGYFPVRIEALPEGTCINAHVPVIQITAEHEFARLVTYLETLLTHVWYPSTVATLSRRARDLVEEAFERSVEGGRDDPGVEFKLHDFGMRGCTSVEQTVLGGVAHLINFRGTDTMSAAYYAQFELNGGRPVAQSIPATEHSVMTSWPTERDAILNMIEHFGQGPFACVMDSYDYRRALEEVLPTVVKEKESAGGYLVLRPDSGDPVEAVLMGLRAAERAFGAETNKKGYKVPRGVGVIQGDGINYATMKGILEAVLKEGYSAESVTFGMGGGLLQRVNRDTMSFATKLSYVRYANGTETDVMKMPTTDAGKFSLPGVLQVRRVGPQGAPTVFPAGYEPPEAQGPNLLRVVYDSGPVAGAFVDDFDTVRARVGREWRALPRRHDPISPALRTKVNQFMAMRGRPPIA